MKVDELLPENDLSQYLLVVLHYSFVIELKLKLFY